jgi:hypothetical protein
LSRISTPNCIFLLHERRKLTVKTTGKDESGQGEMSETTPVGAFFDG